MHRFPVVGRNHFDRIPRTSIKKRAVRSFARAFLTADAKVRIDFDAAKWRVVLIRDPKHAGFDRTILDASWRACAARAAVGGNREYPRPFFALGLAIADGHGPVLLDHVEYVYFFEFRHVELRH